MATARAPWRGWRLTLTLAAVTAAVLALLPAVLRPYYIVSWSMAPTLLPHDVILVLRDELLPVAYGVDDLVLLRLPDETRERTKLPAGAAVVKRLAGLPGDVIEVRRGAGIFRNNRPLPGPTGGMAPDYASKLVGGRCYRILDDGSVWWAAPDGRLERLGNEAAAARVVRAPPGPVPAGAIFVLGDNQPFSLDSLSWGPVDESCVRGRVLGVVYPLHRRDGG